MVRRGGRGEDGLVSEYGRGGRDGLTRVQALPDSSRWDVLRLTTAKFPVSMSAVAQRLRKQRAEDGAGWVTWRRAWV